MTLPDGYRLLPLTDAHRSELIDLDMWAFPTGVPRSDLDALPLPLTWDRTWGVETEGPEPGAVPIDGAVPMVRSLTAVHSSYPFTRFPVPGATTPVSGLTWVGVHPQHRRRGLLSAMIDQHFQDCVDRGEAVSALFAAEATIYGRFGYGVAAHDLRITIPRGAPLHPVAGSAELTVRVETLDPERHGDLVAGLHARAGRPAHTGGLNRPGWATRETPELHTTVVADPVPYRFGREQLRIVIVESDGEPRGYATFRRKISWEPGEASPVKVGEFVAVDPAATHRLWSTLLDLDLTTEISPFMLAPDDPILSLLVNPRAAHPRMVDNLWVRIIDVPVALAARSYAGDLDVVLHVTDERVPANAGSWRITATAFGEVTVTRSTEAPDLALSIADLSAIYLGGTRLTGIAAAGRVEEHTEGALVRTAAAFSWPVAPLCGWVF